jgi:dsDNA-specific endonuclease/ATPase MutS2
MFYKTRAEQEEKKISKPHTKNNSAYEMEIDLHIEELIDNYKGMSNAEIVVIQLRHFEIALDEAINAHCRRLTVIHGVGNGRLKTEVRNILSAQGLRFHDASYSKYGFGATEVIF